MIRPSGSRTFKWPFLHSINYLSVTPFTIDLNLQVLTEDNLHINMPCTFVVRSGIPEELAATGGRRGIEEIERSVITNFMGLSDLQIRKTIENMIVSAASDVIARQRINAMLSGHDNLVRILRRELTTRLQEFDHQLESLQIRDITDKEGYIEARCTEAALAERTQCEERRAELKRAELTVNVVVPAEMEESKAWYESEALRYKLFVEAEGHGLDLTQHVDAIRALHGAGITDPKVINTLLLLENLPEIIAAIPPGTTLKDGKEDKKTVLQVFLQTLLDMIKKMIDAAAPPPPPP